MTWLQSPRSRYVAVALGSAFLGFLAAWPVFGAGQDKHAHNPDPGSQHVHPDGGPTGQPADPNKDLADQVRLLSAKVARLEAALAKIAPPAGGMGGMGGMGGGGMGMMGMDGMMGMGGMKGGGMPGMGGMSGGGMGMADDDMDIMGMMGMGSMSGPGMKGMARMKMAAALPGFPGASHIYHIGATGFFLDHPEHITLTPDQQARLARIKEKALTDKANAQRKVEEAEQQLWALTGSDRPDAAQIEAAVREIEKFRGEQRLAFIRAVGEAAQVLTDDQRRLLLGTAPPAPSPHVHPGGSPASK